MFSNAHARLVHHRNSLRASDYRIDFLHATDTIEAAIEAGGALAEKLVGHLHAQDRTVKGCLVARVTYVRLSTEEEVVYYHTSSPAEVIDDATEFFIAHMLKIGERMATLHANGSNLLIKAITCIHMQITVLN